MRKQYIMFVRSTCFVLLAMAVSVAPLTDETSRTAYGNLPLVFQPNHGQSDRQVRFLSRGNGYGLFLTDTEAVLAINRAASTVVRMRLAGQNPRPTILPL